MQNNNNPLFPAMNEVSQKMPPQTRQVMDGIIELAGLPDALYGVKLLDEDGNPMIEVRHDKELAENEFRIDYTHGYAYLHRSKNKKTLTIQEFYSRGLLWYPASRIYTIDEDGYIDIANSVQEYIATLRLWQYQGAYDAKREYRLHNSISYNGTTYIALKDIPKHTPPGKDSTAYWSPLAAGYGEPAAWSDSTAYSPRDAVIYGHSLYVLRDGVTGNTTGKQPDKNSDIWIKLLSVQEIYDEWSVQQGNIADAISIAGEAADSANLAADTANTAAQEADEARESIVTEWQGADGNSGIKAEAQAAASAAFDAAAQANSNANLAFRAADAASAAAQNADTAREAIVTQWQGESGEGGIKYAAIEAASKADTAAEAAEAAADRAYGAANTVLTQWQGTDGNGGIKAEAEQAVQNAAQAAEDANAALSEMEKWQFTGEYNPGTAYQKNNICTCGGTAYIALQDGFSGKYPKSEPAYWQELAKGLSPRGDYNAATTYYKNDLVTDAQHRALFLCLESGTGTDLHNPTFWQELVTVAPIIDSVMALAVPDGTITDAKIGDRTIENPQTDSGTITGKLTPLLSQLAAAIRALRGSMDTHDVDGGPFLADTTLLCGEAIVGECVVGGGEAALDTAIAARADSESEGGTVWVDHVTPLNAENMNKIESNIEKKADAEGLDSLTISGGEF